MTVQAVGDFSRWERAHILFKTPVFSTKIDWLGSSTSPRLLGAKWLQYLTGNKI